MHEWSVAPRVSTDMPQFSPSSDPISGSPPRLRPYQTEAVKRVVGHFRASSAPAVVVLPTGSGKSLVIAELARLARGRVLVLAHVRELVEQNHAKYQAYGLQADIFSAGLKRKEASRQVVFGSVQSVVRNLERFSDASFTLLVIDECHRVSLEKDASYRQVIEHLRRQNPQLKILGLTATPFRLGQGFIYHRHHHGMVRGDEACFFADCVFEQPLRLMVKQGFWQRQNGWIWPLKATIFLPWPLRPVGCFVRKSSIALLPVAVLRQGLFSRWLSTLKNVKG